MSYSVETHDRTNQLRYIRDRQIGLKQTSRRYRGEWKRSDVAVTLNRIAERKSSTRCRNRQMLPLTGTPKSTFFITFSSDGKLMATLHGDHTIKITDLTQNQVVKTLEGHSRTPWCGEFHKTYRDVFVSGCLAGVVRIWNIQSGISDSWKMESQHSITSLSLHPTEKIALITAHNNIYLWNWVTQYEPYIYLTTGDESPSRFRFVRFSPHGDYFYTGRKSPHRLLYSQLRSTFQPPDLPQRTFSSHVQSPRTSANTSTSTATQTSAESTSLASELILNTTYISDANESGSLDNANRRNLYIHPYQSNPDNMTSQQSSNSQTSQPNIANQSNPPDEPVIEPTRLIDSVLHQIRTSPSLPTTENHQPSTSIGPPFRRWLNRYTSQTTSEPYSELYDGGDEAARSIFARQANLRNAHRNAQIRISVDRSRIENPSSSRVDNVETVNVRTRRLTAHLPIPRDADEPEDADEPQAWIRLAGQNIRRQSIMFRRRDTPYTTQDVFCVQRWEFTDFNADIDVADTYNNIAHGCIIHNNSSLDISPDGRLLAVIQQEGMNRTILLLNLFDGNEETIQLDRNPVLSISFSPCSNYLAVGMNGRPTPVSAMSSLVSFDIYSLHTLKSCYCVRSVIHSSFTNKQSTLNCINWLPRAGQGLVVGTNQGDVIIHRTTGS